MKPNNNRFREKTRLEKHQREVRRSRRILITALAVLFASLILGFWMLFTTAAQATSLRTQFEYNYPSNVRHQCRQVGKDYGYLYAIQCAETVLENRRIEEVRQSQLALNQAKIDYLEDRHHGRRVRR